MIGLDAMPDNWPDASRDQLEAWEREAIAADLYDLADDIAAELDKRDQWMFG